MSSRGQKLLGRAVKLADWFVAGQVARGSDANRGRYTGRIDIRASRAAAPVHTTNWTTGMTVISMLMVWQRTRAAKYLDSARLGGDYIKSLQVTDSGNRRAFGMIREVTPQSDWCHPRDALSAAWALLHLGMLAGDGDSLRRAGLFAEWFRTAALRKRYPAWTCYADGRKPYWQLGSFHGGSPLFFFDLHAATRDKRWLTVGLGICDQWIRIFPRRDGSIRIEVDPDTGRDLTGRGARDHVNWQYMHRFNDDFTALALMRAYLLTWREKYLAAAKRYLDWILDQQRPAGSFGRPSVNSAAATLIIELLDLARITGQGRYLDACMRSVDHFLSLQELRRRDRRLAGGFYGVPQDYNHAARTSLNARTGAYALAALLKLEGNRRYLGYTA